MKEVKNEYLLGLVSLLNDVGSEMIAPWIPLFVTSLGGGPVIIGLVNGIHKGFHNLFIFPTGYISDKFRKRKLWLYLGYGLSAMAKFIMGLINTPIQLILLSAVDRAGKGVRTAPRDSILTETDRKERGWAFGIQMTLDKVGAFIGTIIGLLLILVFKVELNILFMMAGIFSFSALIPISKVKSKFEIKIFQENEINFEKKLYVLALLYALTLIGYMFFIIDEKDIVSIGIVYMIFNLANTVGPIIAGKFIDKKKTNLVFKLAIFMVILAYIIMMVNQHYKIIAIALFGMGSTFNNIIMRTKIANNTNLRNAGKIFGVYNTIIGVGTIITNLVAGIIWTINQNYMFLYATITTLMFAIGFLKK